MYENNLTTVDCNGKREGGDSRSRGEELRKVDGEETDGSRDWKEVVRIERLMGNLSG